LRELRLPVGPQLFVPKALHELEVTVHARHHEHLDGRVHVRSTETQEKGNASKE
jgi:hypothetical protein